MASRIALITEATRAYNKAFACSQNVKAAISAYERVMGNA